MRHNLQSLQHQTKHQASADLRKLQTIEDPSKRFAARRSTHDTRQSRGHTLRDQQFASLDAQLVLFDVGLLGIVALPGLGFLFCGQGVFAELVDVAGDASVREVIVESGLLQHLADAFELRVAGA